MSWLCCFFNSKKVILGWNPNKSVFKKYRCIFFNTKLTLFYFENFFFGRTFHSVTYIYARISFFILPFSSSRLRLAHSMLETKWYIDVFFGDSLVNYIPKLNGWNSLFWALVTNEEYSLWLQRLPFLVSSLSCQYSIQFLTSNYFEI